MQTTVLRFRPAIGYYAFRERGLVTGHSHARAFDSAAGACRIELFDLELLLLGACDPFSPDQLLEAIAATSLGLSPNRLGSGLTLAAVIGAATPADKPAPNW